MLLLSSNVSGRVNVNHKTYALPEIPGADREVRKLENKVADLRKSGKIAFSVDVKYDVTCDEMVELLQYGEYDVVHYSGHGFFAESSEDSCLFFWEQPGGISANNKIVTLSANELNALVERTKIRFMYLSCCQGGTAGAVVTPG